MPEIIKITGEVAQVVREEIVATVSVNELIQKMDESAPRQTPLLPPHGCRIYKAAGAKEGGRQLFVIEEPAAVRTIRWLHEGLPARQDGSREPEILNLAFPYMIFIVRTNAEGAILEHGTQLFCRKSPLDSMDAELFAPPSPNVNLPTDSYNNQKGHGCSVCTGEIRITAGRGAGAAAAELVAAFWRFTANNDLPENWRWVSTRNEPYKTPANWKQATIDNPMFPVAPETHYRRVATLKEIIAWNGPQ